MLNFWREKRVYQIHTHNWISIKYIATCVWWYICTTRGFSYHLQYTYKQSISSRMLTNTAILMGILGIFGVGDFPTNVSFVRIYLTVFVAVVVVFRFVLIFILFPFYMLFYRLFGPVSGCISLLHAYTHTCDQHAH